MDTHERSSGKPVGPAGFVHSYETLGALDGPGLRLVVFLQGCPLRCRYCHNPDTWPMGSAGERAMRVYPDDIVHRARRLRPYFGKTGGVTLSGGEPLAQPAFTLAVLQALKAAGIRTALDTSGWFATLSSPRSMEYPAPALEILTAILENVDLILLDIKHPDPQAFLWLTGQSIEPLLAFLALCARLGKSLWLRQVIVPDWNDKTDPLKQWVRLIQQFPGLQVKRWQLLPYHTLGLAKYQQLGLDYPLGDRPALSIERLAQLQTELDQLVRQAFP